MIMYHPSIIILASVLALISSAKYLKLFRFLAIFSPILAAYFLYFMPEKEYMYISHLRLIYDGTFYIKLLGYGFLLVLLVSNIYCLGQKKNLELIFGSSYGAASLFCLFAGDFLSMFVGLELMMVFSSMIIFIGGNRDSIRSAKKYFVTHFVSSNMILVGIIYFFSKTGSFEIINVVSFINNSSYYFISIMIMLIGMLINIAVFPFSGWMVRYYQKASPSGFLYLISFTTKVSIVILAKVFAGLGFLKYVAIVMIFYASIKAIVEDNLLSLLCYLSIMVMGFMLIGLSQNGVIVDFIIFYLFLHVLYKLLLSVSCAVMIDNANISNCSNLQKIGNNLLVIGFVVGTSMLLTIPGSVVFSIKSEISKIFTDNIVLITIVFLSFFVAFALPWKEYFTNSDRKKIKLNIYTKVSLLIAIITTILFSNNLFWGKQLNLLSLESLKQIIIIIVAIVLSFYYTPKRFITKPINLIEIIGGVFHRIYLYYKKNISKKRDTEPLDINSLQNQIKSTFSVVLHNQQTSIFIVFIIFLLMLFVLLIALKY